MIVKKKGTMLAKHILICIVLTTPRWFMEAADVEKSSEYVYKSKFATSNLLNITTIHQETTTTPNTINQTVIKSSTTPLPVVTIKTTPYLASSRVNQSTSSKKENPGTINTQTSRTVIEKTFTTQPSTTLTPTQPARVLTSTHETTSSIAIKTKTVSKLNPTSQSTNTHQYSTSTANQLTSIYLAATLTATPSVTVSTTNHQTATFTLTTIQSATSLTTKYVATTATNTRINDTSTIINQSAASTTALPTTASIYLPTIPTISHLTSSVAIILPTINSTTKLTYATTATSTSLPTTATTTIYSIISSSIPTTESSPAITSSTTTNPTTTSIIEPELPPFYGNVTFNILWKEFCKYSEEFKSGIARLLNSKLEEKLSENQVVIANIFNCVGSPHKIAAVLFYVTSKGTNTGDKDLTLLAIQGLRETNGASIGAHLGKEKIVKVVVVKQVKNSEKTKWPVWLVLLLIISIFLLMLLLLCCCWMCCTQTNNVKKTNHLINEGTPLHVISSKENPETNPNVVSNIYVSMKPAPAGIRNPSYETVVPTTPYLNIVSVIPSEANATYDSSSIHSNASSPNSYFDMDVNGFLAE